MLLVVSLRRRPLGSILLKKCVGPFFFVIESEKKKKVGGTHKRKKGGTHFEKI
jgi:hypothetical protein